MNKLFQFGVKVEGYRILVLNEREIRASAGILFVMMYTSLMFVIFRENFALIKYTITLFLTDFAIRVFINPHYSPSLILGRLFVSNQNPEYVGAAQKKFAWSIGLCLATIMFLHMVVYNTYSIITALICLICLVFLFFESVFGICLGCFFYKWFTKKEVEYCPGEVCDTKTKDKIQKISLMQFVILAVFVVFIVMLTFFANNHFSLTPMDLWEKLALYK